MSSRRTDKTPEVESANDGKAKMPDFLRNKERRIHYLARRNGYVVRKSRARKYVPKFTDCGRYMLLEANRWRVVLGERFDATLDDIEAFFTAPKAA